MKKAEALQGSIQDEFRKDPRINVYGTDIRHYFVK
jgi:pyruvate/2-oxoglutarate/acetoin dehydrogenase E1 component